MRIVKVVAKGLPLYRDEQLTLDLYATDRVARGEDGAIHDVMRLGTSGAIYSQNVLGFVGVNASGKTSTLNLLEFIVSYLTDRRVSRHLAFEQGRLGGIGKELDLSVVFWKTGHSIFWIRACAARSRKAEDPVACTGTTWFLRTKCSGSLIRRTRSARSWMILSYLRAAPRFSFVGTATITRTLLCSQLMSARTWTAIRASCPVSRDRSVSASRVRWACFPREDLPAPVLRAFDPSIESLSYDPELQVYHLKFYGEAEGDGA